MLDISRTGQIIMNRGDDISLCLFIDSGDNIDSYRYDLSDDDILYFGVIEPNKDFECGVIRKAYKKNISEDESNKYLKLELNDDDNIIIKIDSKDTINLLTGDYYYEIKLLRKLVLNGKETDEIHTIIPKTKFTIV